MEDASGAVDAQASAAVAIKEIQPERARIIRDRAPARARDGPVRHEHRNLLLGDRQQLAHQFGFDHELANADFNLPFHFVLNSGRRPGCDLQFQTRFAIVEAVCQLSRKINLDVVVEGVETDEQRVIIELMGATKGQGWLFGKPTPSPHGARQQMKSVA